MSSSEISKLHATENRIIITGTSESARDLSQKREASSLAQSPKTPATLWSFSVQQGKRVSARNKSTVESNDEPDAPRIIPCWMRLNSSRSCGSVKSA